MSAGVSRSRFLRLAGGIALVLVPPGRAFAGVRSAPSALRVAARNIGRRYSTDRDLFATVSPGVPGRDAAALSFRLARPATVRVEAVRTALRASHVTWERTVKLRSGGHKLVWTPDPTTAVGSYVLRMTVTNRSGQTVIGARRPVTIADQRAPVVRVLGVEAAFLGRSFLPGAPMPLRILTDAASFTLQFLRLGYETEATERNNELAGALKGDPVQIDWTGKRSSPVTIDVQTGAWQPGVYAARLTTDDGRVGFAPFVLRSATPEEYRQLVVLPTNTWQAYNMYDADGDGWGDTWYAGGRPRVDLTRPYRDNGVPPRFRAYDRSFLRWLARTGKAPDFAADDDLETFPSGDDLRARYDLVVFPGHTEYMTEHAYNVVERYRDLGGRIVFLSANNFFWKVESDGSSLQRIRQWREEGRPESRLCGVQYLANDDGTRQAPYTVVAAEAAPWLFDKTGLATGSTFGETVGGFGIEIDATTPESPPGTVVLARVTDLFGAGRSGEMTYYETPAGARVFAAGTLDFGGVATFWPMSRMLENLWAHMLQDLPPAPPAPPAA